MTITLHWWLVPILLTVAIWVYFFHLEDNSQYKISSLIGMLFAACATLGVWLVYFMFFAFTGAP